MSPAGIIVLCCIIPFIVIIVGGGFWLALGANHLTYHGIDPTIKDKRNGKN